MSKGRELIKNTFLLMAAKISTQIVSFLLLPLYTKILATSEYGEIDLYSSLAMIVIPFLTLQIEMGLFRFYLSESQIENKKRIISTSFILVLITLGIGSAGYFLISLCFSLKHLIYVYFYYLTSTLSTVFLQVCRAYGKNKEYGIITFLNSTSAIILNIIFIVYLNLGVEGILLSTVLSQVLTCNMVVFCTKVFNEFSFKNWDITIAKKLLHFSFPLVFNQVSSWTINYSDRLIVISAWGISLNGVYSIANKFSNITNTFYNIFNLAWTENVVKAIDDKDNKKYINSVFAIIMSLYLFGITGIINVLPFVWKWLINEKYDDAYGHIPILLLAMFFSGMAATLGSVYIACNKTKEVSITTCLAGICNIIVHFGLLRLCGLYAASISTLAAFTILFVYRWIVIQRFFQIKFDIFVFFIQAITFGLSWFFYFMRNTYLVAGGFILNIFCFGIICWKYRKQILEFVKCNI